MQKATISELKRSLSAYLEKVRAGHTVVIYDRDQPVARLERFEVESCGDERVERLERAGLMRRGIGRDPLELLRVGAPTAKRSVTQALIDERLA